jgi:hypothetical protein
LDNFSTAHRRPIGDHDRKDQRRRHL